MKSTHLVFLMAFLLFACQKAADSTQTQLYTPKMQKDYLKPPTVAQKSKEFTEHGSKRTDNYFWLKEKENPEVIAYLKAENTYFDTVMAHTAAFQDKLYKEMRGRIKEDDQSVPVSDKGFLYYNRTEKDKQYRIYCRKKGDINASEEVMIDGNKMAEGKPYFGLGGLDVSPDTKIMAYSYNYEGSSVKFDLHFRDLTTGKEFSETIPNAQGFVWANDNKTVFYTTLDASLRPYRLYKHSLGTPAEKDVLIYEEKDELFNLDIGKSKSEEYIIMSMGSFTSSEARILPANQPDGKFEIFLPRAKDVEYSIDHHKDKFFVQLKDKDHKNYWLLEAPLKDYNDRKNWKEVVPYDAKTRIEGFEIFEKFLAVTERNNGLLKIRVLDLATKQSKYVEFPEPVYTVYPSGTPDYQSNTMRYVYTSLNRPNTTYEYDMTTGQAKSLKVQEVVGGFNSEEYEVKRLFAKAPDGVEVPMSVVYKKGIKLDGSQPAFLYSYGSYGYSTDATFSTNRISLLDRGFVFVLAHIRGGSDMGEEWYEDGKMLKKKNTFTDFIACAEHLIKEKYTSPEKMVINGGSAGGLLMGAVTNMRPDLFKVVLADVPFVDVLNTMFDETLPLTTQEWEQWGNPKIKEYYDYIKSYSPYDNVEKKNYPNILATTGLNDSQVSYHEPAKWVAKLREMKTDDNIILLHTNMGAGHGGASGRFDYLKEVAFHYAFAMDRLGMGE